MRSLLCPSAPCSSESFKSEILRALRQRDPAAAHDASYALSTALELARWISTLELDADSRQALVGRDQAVVTALSDRVMDRKAGGGLETYQFLVDDPKLLTGSTVRVRARFNDSATGYDPSLADAWSLPVPTT